MLYNGANISSHPRMNDQLYFLVDSLFLFINQPIAIVFIKWISGIF